MIDSSSENGSAETPPPQRRRLWPWFLLGFGVVFVGMAVAYPMYFFDGRSVRQTVLGHYYFLEIQQASDAEGVLGPTSGGIGRAMVTAVEHIVISAIAGAIAMGVGWLFPRRAYSTSNR